MPLEYEEVFDNDSPMVAGFTIRQSMAKGAYIVTGVEDRLDLFDIPQDILGYTFIDETTQQLRRIPPRCHPVYPNLYASAITSIQGLGQPTVETSAEPLLVDGVTFPTYGLYAGYKVEVEFSTRTDLPLTDTYVSYIDGNTIIDPVLGDGGIYYPSDTNVPYKFAYYTENGRYTYFTQTPKEDFITFQQGNMEFKSADADINGKLFTDSPRMFLPNSEIIIHWLQVPYAYVVSANCKFDHWRGRINQGDFLLNNRVFSAGSLLYNSWSVTRYTPPETSTPGLDGFTGLIRGQLCDIQFRFLYTDRKDIAGAGAFDFTKFKYNWLPKGWNLQPNFLKRVFSFTHNKDADQTNWYPNFLSFPMDDLFQNPDDSTVGVPLSVN